METKMFLQRISDTVRRFNRLPYSRVQRVLAPSQGAGPVGGIPYKVRLRPCATNGAEGDERRSVVDQHGSADQFALFCKLLCIGRCIGGYHAEQITSVGKHVGVQEQRVFKDVVPD